MSCSVKNCKNLRRFMPEGVSFHRFPKNEHLKHWLKVLNLNPEKWTWTRNKYVCSKHFKYTDYIHVSSKKILTKMAVPSLHLDPASQTHLQRIKETHAEPEDNGYFEYSEGDLQNPHRVYVKSHISTQDFQNNCHVNSSDSTENTPITYVKTIHNYCASPTKWKEKYEALKIRHRMCMRKVYSANKKILRLELKISNMFKTIEQLKSQSK